MYAPCDSKRKILKKLIVAIFRKIYFHTKNPIQNLQCEGEDETFNFSIILSRLRV
jgi:hypothetical protein